MRGISRPLQAVTRCRPSSSGLSIPRPGRRKVSALAQKSQPLASPNPTDAWTASSTTPQYPLSKPPIAPTRSKRTDPYQLAEPELQQIRSNLLNLLGSAHPGLTSIAEYYFLHPSKQLRSLLVLLVSRATNGIGEDWPRKQWEAEMEAHGGRGASLDKPLRSSATLNEWNPNMPDDTESFAGPFEMRNVRRADPGTQFVPPHPLSTGAAVFPWQTSKPLPTQLRLAQIVEMIHIASLMHENISNSSPEGTPSPPSETENPFGNKLSILGGDFLLGRASTVLSRLGEAEVVELVASVISNIVEGEFLRMHDVRTPSLGLVAAPQTVQQAWEVYWRKTYLNSASLLAKGARAAAVLGGCKNDIWKEAVYLYGRNLGIATQLIEDAKEYEGSSSGPSRPATPTAPAIFAWQQFKDLGFGSLCQRNFSEEDDRRIALETVQMSTGIAQTKELAYAHAERARKAIQSLPDSDAKDALEGLCDEFDQYKNATKWRGL